MATQQYCPRKNSEMLQHIELEDTRLTKSYDQSNCKSVSEQDYHTPITNRTSFSFEKEEILNSGQEHITGNDNQRKYPQKPHSTQTETRDRVKKMIRQSSEVGMLLLESSTEQVHVPKRVQGMIKRGSGRIEHLLLDGAHKNSRKEPTKGSDHVIKRHKSSLHNLVEQSRLDTIPSPCVVQIEQDVEDDMIFSPTENFGVSSLGTVPLLPVQISVTQPSTPSPPSTPIPYNTNNYSKFSNSSLTGDMMSMSASMGNLTELPERLIESITLNHPEEVTRQLENFGENGPPEALINRGLWYACAHGAEKSAEVIMNVFHGNPNYVYRNVPCIQLAARRGNVALLTLILDEFPDLVRNVMPKDACVKLNVPSETSYGTNKQSDSPSSDNVNSSSRRSSCSLGERRSKDKKGKMRFSQKNTKFRGEEERKNSIVVNYTPLSTPLHQTTLTNDVEMTKIILEKYKADIEATDCESKTPLMYAAEEGSVNTLQYLLECEADIEVRDANRHTALLLAVKNGNRQCILLLLQKGSNENAKDNKGRGLFEIAKDETVCIYVAKLLVKDSLTVRLPLHGLVKKGYSHCFQLIVDNTIHYRGDSWEFDLRTFQMDDNGVLPENELDYKEKKQSLLQLISSSENMDFVDCLPLRILVSHWLSRYGVWYIFLKLFYFILNMTALSYLFINAAHESAPNKHFNFNGTTNSIQVICLVIVLLGWLMHLIFEVCEMGLRCKARWDSIRTRRKETEGKISLQMDTINLFQSISYGLFDYLRSLHNLIDLVIISSLPLFLIFCYHNSPIQWYFASFLYFSRSLEVVKLLTVSPFGIYVHTIWATLSGDLPKFIFIVALSLIAFIGALFIAFRAPSNDYVNQTLTITEMDLLRPDGETSVWWLIMTSLRLLIEQGSVVKVDYITLFNWFAVIIFFLMLGWILLILRVIFIAHVSNTYAVSRNRAERYVTAYKLDFLLKMNENSFIALFIDLKKRFYNPTLKKTRKEIRKYFESDNSYSQWNSTWVERVEDALNARKKRNNMRVALTDPIEGRQDHQFAEYISDGSKKRSCSVLDPSEAEIDIIYRLQSNLKSEMNIILEEHQRKIEQNMINERREINEKIDDLKQTTIREIAKLASQFIAHGPVMSDSDD
ncbi:Ankyrin repeat containing protein [Oopsacas minuta]|uniref:Ankyrin repeat containing protein n=1 Tax=Oopsacas minuta TaxID=111878 RepID=A0AAV7KBP9_9METZ|nr:Ankyrin repeat containing protein [Oopsacas minuta]